MLQSTARTETAAPGGLGDSVLCSAEFRIPGASGAQRSPEVSDSREKTWVEQGKNYCSLHFTVSAETADSVGAITELNNLAGRPNWLQAG